MNNENLSRDRKRFAAALGLFLAWVALLIGLGVKSGYRPMDRGDHPVLDVDARRTRVIVLTVRVTIRASRRTV